MRWPSAAICAAGFLSARLRKRDSCSGGQLLFLDSDNLSEGFEFQGRFLNEVVETVQPGRGHGVAQIHFEQQEVVEKVVNDVVNGSHRGLQCLQLLRLNLCPMAAPPVKYVEDEASANNGRGRQDV